MTVKVSAIMPTRGRPEFALLALGSFLCQSYPDKELIILDDEDSPSFPDGVTLPTVRYFRNARRLTVGKKRNLCCERAGGEIILHFDDDDWSSPHRMLAQVRRIQEVTAVTGFRSLVFFDGERFSRFTGQSKYALGTSLAYFRTWWEVHQFEDVMIGEDNIFVKAAVLSEQLDSIQEPVHIIARIHIGNTSRKSGSYSDFDRALVPEAYPFR